ncbi:hypothetical protein B0T25DRAFT_238050 [Lasiosphaeria hispida]|uniref:WD40 repeat-like protein n=1 Tax=Lasiosphaeria hispida TaxID=260671 RepID=A0AAJ0MC94_9PEZI|nr:hypothetical protein B0T25DRAFT_238050 [Lasiosphaeria hispida]
MPQLDPLVRSAAEMDQMAETLRRIDTGGSNTNHTLTLEEWQERSRLLSATNGSCYSQPPTGPSSPWFPEDDQMFRLPSYDGQNHALLTRPTSRGLPFGRREKAERRPSRASTTGSAGFSLYPAPSKPPGMALPPVPTIPKNARRISSRGSADGSDVASSSDVSRYSQCSTRTTSNQDRTSISTLPTSPPPPIPTSPYSTRHAPYEDRPTKPPHAQSTAAPIDLAAWKVLSARNEKGVKDPAIYSFDVSTSATTLASKHGNNLIKVWSVGSGTVQNTIKISCYTTAQARSREYFVRSHAILSEPTTMMAIATGFGDTLEIWDWAKKKKLQAIDKADRWAAVRSNVYESAWAPLVIYRGDNDTLELYSATHAKKPFRKSRTIELRRAGLPVLPKYPELAFSATSPLLVTASGPRPPRLGHPPPERETLLVAWEIHNQEPDTPNGVVSSEPYRVVAPWQHPELDTALPSGLATYGSVAVSIWIPASYRAVPVPAARGGQGFNLQPVPVNSRHVMIWDFSANSTRTFRIPNAISCVSPDCRYVAFCDTRGTESGARGCMVILDAMTGKQLWCWPDPEASAGDSGPKQGFEQLERLGKVTELSFAADSGFLFVGDVEGSIGVYEIREVQERLSLRPM